MRTKVKVHDRDTGWVGFFKTAQRLRTMGVRAGLVGPQAERQHSNGLTVAEVGLLNEFGAPGANIPERAFMRDTLERRRRIYRYMLRRAAIDALTSRREMREVFGEVGQRMEDDIRATIMSGAMPPPNAPSTIKHKGFDRPLYETGLLAESIAHQVIHNDEVVGGTGGES